MSKISERKMEKRKLKKGDLVVMHTCMEHDNPKWWGKVWTCKTDEFQHKGHDYGSIFLEGFSGSFSTEFLQFVDLSGQQEEINKLREERDLIQAESDQYKVWRDRLQNRVIQLSKGNTAMINGFKAICEAYDSDGTDLQVARKMAKIAKSFIADIEKGAEGK